MYESVRVRPSPWLMAIKAADAAVAALMPHLYMFMMSTSLLVCRRAIIHSYIYGNSSRLEDFVRQSALEARAAATRNQ